MWYRWPVSTQIAVRLPDEIVEFIDEMVAAGQADSRAEVVQRALRRERRRIEADRDAAIYAADNTAGLPDEFSAMRAHATRRTLDID